MASKHMTDLTKVSSISDTDLLLVETSNGTRTIEKSDSDTNLQDQIDSIKSDLSKKIVFENRYDVTLNSNWCVITPLYGYLLAAAYSMRDDSSFFVEAITHRSNGNYTIQIKNANGGTVNLFLIWVKA